MAFTYLAMNTTELPLHKPVYENHVICVVWLGEFYSKPDPVSCLQCVKLLLGQQSDICTCNIPIWFGYLFKKGSNLLLILFISDFVLFLYTFLLYQNGGWWHDFNLGY